MFESGEKVVCVDKKYIKKYNLKNKSYTISNYVPKKNNFFNNDLIIIEGERYGYNAKYFLSIKDYRKLKLEQICLNKKIK